MGFVPSDASSVLLGVASDLERELRRGAADDGRADAGRAAEPPASSRLPVRRSPPGVVAVLGVDGPEKRNDRRPGDVARDSGREVISPRSPRREVLRPAESPSARTVRVRVRSAIATSPVRTRTARGRSPWAFFKRFYARLGSPRGAPPQARPMLCRVLRPSPCRPSSPELLRARDALARTSVLCHNHVELRGGLHAAAALQSGGACSGAPPHTAARRAAPPAGAYVGTNAATCHP